VGVLRGIEVLRSLVLVLVLGGGGFVLGCGGVARDDLVAWTHYYAVGFGLDPLFLEALVLAESNFCVSAVSSAGAIGLGQLMPGTAASLGVNPYDPLQNLWGTASYLRQKYLEFGDWTLALAAYNAGSGNVRRYGGVPPFAETRAYVDRVFRFYRELRGGG
jgi:soluble lytic murein transglycosylase-like protein